VFAVSAVGKLRDPGGFIAAVRNYEVLPKPLVVPVGRALPVVELGVAAALVFGVWVVPTALVAAALLVVFAVGIWINVRRGRSIGCGCGLARRQTVSNRLVARNGLLAATAALAALFASDVLMLLPGPGVSASSISPIDAVGALVATVSAAALAMVVVEVQRFLKSRGASLLRARA